MTIVRKIHRFIAGYKPNINNSEAMSPKLEAFTKLVHSEKNDFTISFKDKFLFPKVKAW